MVGESEPISGMEYFLLQKKDGKFTDIWITIQNQEMRIYSVCEFWTKLISRRIEGSREVSNKLP